jgi:hypothetical protein
MFQGGDRMTSFEQLNNALTVGIIKTLESMKEVKKSGGNLNDIDFDYLIECRLRDMTNTSFLDSVENTKSISKVSKHSMKNNLKEGTK